MPEDLLFDKSISELKGIGKKRLETFRAAGLSTYFDLLDYLPKKYENWTDVSDISPDNCGVLHAFDAVVSSRPVNVNTSRKITLTRFAVTDAVTGAKAEVFFFNQPYCRSIFSEGEKYRFLGKLKMLNGRLTLPSPQFRKAEETDNLPSILPVYKLPAGVGQNTMRALLESVLSYVKNSVIDYLPYEILSRYSLCSLEYAYENIHFPSSADALKKSLERFSFDNLFSFFIFNTMMNRIRKNVSGHHFAVDDISRFYSSLDYTLTGSQLTAIRDILSDCAGGDHVSPMNRMIVGDVGSGKTVCAQAAVYLTYLNSMKSIVLAPTEILARQHFRSFSDALSGLGVSVDLLCGSMSKSEKNAAIRRYTDGDTDVLVGTHALLNNCLSSERTGLVVTDEQHKFGVLQRSELLKMNSVPPHFLSMTATPIPRSLALSMVGGIDVSRITDMPPGRKTVKTYYVDYSYKERLLSYVKNTVAEGRQVFVVCSRIHDPDDSDDGMLAEEVLAGRYNSSGELHSAEETYRELYERLPGIRIGLLHGELKDDVKQEIMQAFAEGRTDVLVSTTVIEVGINIPNATLMIILDADRFGLAQLHQLRGRVGRSSFDSSCVLVSGAKNDNSVQRLEYLKNESNGYKIAEYDLKTRGPGDFFSRFDNDYSQHGKTFADIAGKFGSDELMLNAYEAARAVFDCDSLISSEGRDHIIGHVKRMYKADLSVQN